MTARTTQWSLFETDQLPTLDSVFLESDDIVPNKGRAIFAILLRDGQNYVNAEWDVLPINRKKHSKQEPWPDDLSFFNH